jgi:hypothetical protein
MRGKTGFPVYTYRTAYHGIDSGAAARINPAASFHFEGLGKRFPKRSQNRASAITGTPRTAVGLAPIAAPISRPLAQSQPVSRSSRQRRKARRAAERNIAVASST